MAQFALRRPWVASQAAGVPAGPWDHLARLLSPGAGYDALIRFSRGAGLPEPLPDALGVAVKLPDAYGPGRAQDLLVTSSADLPVVRRLLFPGRSFLGRSFSSALPFRVADRRVVAVLRSRRGRWPRTGRALADLQLAAATGELVYHLRLAGSLGRSRTVGRLTVGAPLEQDDTEALAFNPWAGGDLIPVGWLNRLRRPSYAASQQGRREVGRLAQRTLPRPAMRSSRSTRSPRTP